MKAYNYYQRLFYNIKDKCTNPNHRQWKDYGGRGITLYWTDWRTFQQWLLNNLGEKPEGYTLDRENNDKGYEPGNLRWATRAEQIENRRTLSTKVGECGYKWVSRSYNFYKARVRHNNKTYYAGSSKCAASAYLKALALRSLLVPVL